MPNSGEAAGAGRSKASRRKQYSAPALEKGLDILELLAREPEPLTLKDIAGMLGRSVGEIFRMLAVLEQRGYVQTMAGSDRIALTMRLFQLAHWHLPINRLTNAAVGPMRRLALETGQSCHLTVLSEARVVIVARQDSFRDRNFAMRVGAESPLLSSCSGRIFFALASGFVRDTLIQASRLSDADRAEARRADDIAAMLARQSYLEIPSEQVEGIIDIGSPITGHDGTVAAALIIPFLHRMGTDKQEELRLVRASLIRTAAEISLALGQ